MKEAIILVGGNLGDQMEIQERALQLIRENIGDIKKSSGLYCSESWGYNSENIFYNQAIIVITSLKAHKLLDKLLEIEKIIGRLPAKNNTFKSYSDRLIDLDILFYGNEIVNSERLTIPHPFITQRNFVLTPLCNICPEFNHPKLNKSIKELQKGCIDPGKVFRLKERLGKYLNKPVEIC